jgi:hypothetical protein
MEYNPTLTIVNSNLQVKIMDRALLLQANFDLNNNLVKQITTGDFAKRI